LHSHDGELQNGPSHAISAGKYDCFLAFLKSNNIRIILMLTNLFGFSQTNTQQCSATFTTTRTTMLSTIFIPRHCIKPGMDATTTSSTAIDSTEDTSSNSSDHSTTELNGCNISMMTLSSAATTTKTTRNATTTHKRPVEIVRALQRTQTRSDLQALLPPPRRTQNPRGPTQRPTLPSTDYYSSNHVLVNNERMLRGVDPLQRCRHLDDLATVHAQEMADRLDLFHSGTCADVQYRLKSRVVGENVMCGPDIRAMHQTSMSMHGHTNRINILSNQLNQFGMGTAKGEDDYLYMVQLFRHVDEYRL
jgi:uncharacterized protein YkwD